MRQLPSGLRFLEETDPVFMLLLGSDAQNGDRFDGDNTVQYRVAGMINGPHGTTAQHLQNLITSKSFHSSDTGGKNLLLLGPGGKHHDRRTNAEFRHMLKLMRLNPLIVHKRAIGAVQIH